MSRCLLGKHELVQLDQFDIIERTNLSADDFKGVIELTSTSRNRFFLDQFNVIVQSDTERQLCLIIQENVLLHRLDFFFQLLVLKSLQFLNLNFSFKRLFNTADEVCLVTSQRTKRELQKQNTNEKSQRYKITSIFILIF